MTLESASFLDDASFALPPKVAKLDAVRKLIPRLTEVTGLGETAATVLAHAVTDPAAVRNALAEPLPGLTAHPESHLRVIPARVWTPWLAAPADDIARYGNKKRFPVSDPSIPRTPQWEETSDGLTLEWDSPADRDWHLEDNRKLYASDIYRDSLRIFPEKGGIITPLVLVPQTETFRDGAESVSLLRIADGRYRYYGAMDLLKRYAALGQSQLVGHFGPDVITPEVISAALKRDRSALAKLVNAVRDACLHADEQSEDGQFIGVHYLASVLSLPAYIAVGTVDPVTSEIRPVGTDTGYPTGTGYALDRGFAQWHSGQPARVLATGQREYDGLLLPEGSVDDGLTETAVKRLRARGIPKDVVEFGQDWSKAGAAARLVWWTRAVKQLGGSPATAVAAFARHSGEPWPQGVSRPLLACASYLMEEDIDTVYPPGDYRNNEARPDSLSLLAADARNLAAISALTPDGHGGVLAHPRWRNAVHIALAQLALIGALPVEESLVRRVAEHPHLLSHVAACIGQGQTPVFVRPDGQPYRDGEGRAVPIDGRTLLRDDLSWPKGYETRLTYMVPPPSKHPYAASHVFKLRHDVVYTIPTESIDEMEIEATPESLARVVRRWFPDATGITLTDWSDKFITGVMVGSVFVRLFDRRGDREYARSRGVWYPEGSPAGTKDVLDFDMLQSGAPVGMLLGAGDWLTVNDETGGVDLAEVDETWYEELDSAIITEVDDALEAQKAADAERGQAPDTRWSVPVLRLPEIKKGRG